ncbi:MAG: hypothetical protein IJW71_05415 [Clostridia bacterium]|nr:hypothetical protein [Clostridia bacterium]
MQIQKNNHKVSTLVKLLVLALAIFALTVVAFTACGEEEEGVVLENISIASHPNTVTYDLGDTFDCAGATIKVTYSDGTTKTVNVTKDMLVDVEPFDEAGQQLIAVVYAEGKVQKITYVIVTVYDQLGADKTNAINSIASYKEDTDPGVKLLYSACVDTINKATDTAAINAAVAEMKAAVEAYKNGKTAALEEVQTAYDAAALKIGGVYLAQADALKAAAELVITNATTLVDVQTALGDYKITLDMVVAEDEAIWDLREVKTAAIEKMWAAYIDAYGAKEHYYAPQQYKALEAAVAVAQGRIELAPYFTEADGDVIIDELLDELEDYDDYIDWAYQKWAEIGHVMYRPAGAANFDEDSWKKIDAAIDALLTALNNIDGTNYTSLAGIVATDGVAYTSLIAYDEDVAPAVNVIDELNEDVERYDQLHAAYDDAVAVDGVATKLLGLLAAIGGEADIKLNDIDAIEEALKEYIAWLIEYEMLTLNAGINLNDAAYVAILDTVLNSDKTLYEYVETATEDIHNSRDKMIGEAYTELNDIVVVYLGLLETVRLDAEEVIAAIDAIATKQKLAKRSLIEAAEAKYEIWAEKYGISDVTLDPANPNDLGTVPTLSANAFVENVIIAKLAGSYIVTNYTTMIDERATYDALYAEAYIAAQNVLGKIDAIDGVLADTDNDPATPAVVVLNSGATILDAKTAYEAWANLYEIIAAADDPDTTEVETYLNMEYTVIDEENKEDETFIDTYDALKAYFDTYDALYKQAVADAQAIVDLINAIGTVKYDTAPGEAIDSLAAIVAAEDALADFLANALYVSDGYVATDLIDAIDADALDTLEAARTKYDKLVADAKAINDEIARIAALPASYTLRADIDAVAAAIAQFKIDNSEITTPLNLASFEALHETIYVQVFHTHMINGSEYVSATVTMFLSIIPDNSKYIAVRTAINEIGNKYKGILERAAYDYATDDLDEKIEELYLIVDEAINVLFLYEMQAGYMAVTEEAIAQCPAIADDANALMAAEIAKVQTILDAYAASVKIDATVNPYIMNRAQGYETLPIYLEATNPLFLYVVDAYGVDDPTAAFNVAFDAYQTALEELIFNWNAANPNPDDDNETGFPTNP